MSKARHSLRTRGPRFILPILTVLSLQVDLFGLGAVTQTQSENTILRLTAPLYAAREQKSVVAVLLDKPYVEQTPRGSGHRTIPFQKFTAVIDQLLPLDPAAIYIGAVFELRPQEDAAELDRLLLIIEEAVRLGIPVLLPMRTSITPGGGESTCPMLGAPYAVAFDEDSVLPEIRERARQFNGGVRFVAANWNGCLNRYPLMLDKAGKVPSAALLLAGKDRKCQEPEACLPYSEPMLIRWSAFPTPERFAAGAPCTPVQDPDRRRRGAMLWDDIRHAAMQSRDSEHLRGQRPGCHYIDEVLASNLIDDRASVADSIRGRIVLIGTAPSLTQHWMQTPLNGQVPDVIVQAAATENLLSLDRHYLRDMDRSSELLWQLAVAIVVAIAALAIVSRRPPAGWLLRSAAIWWSLGTCLLLVLLVLMGHLPRHWEAVLIIVPLAAAWLMHATITTVATLAFFVIGATLMVIIMTFGTVPIDWIGALLAGSTAVVGADFE